MDRDSGEISGFLNGSNEGWQAGNGTQYSDRLDVVSDIDTTSNLTLGSDNDQAHQYTGALAEVRIWGEARSEADIANTTIS